MLPLQKVPTTWKSNDMLSVGDSTEWTRKLQIFTYIGSESTDTVNVAQLKWITTESASTMEHRFSQVDTHINQVDSRVKLMCRRQARQH